MPLIVCLQLLLSSGADAAALNNEQATALMLAASNGHAPAITTLARALADVSSSAINQRNSNGDTGLIMAAHGGHHAAVAALLSAAADVTACNANGSTPLIAGYLGTPFPSLRHTSTAPSHAHTAAQLPYKTAPP